MALKNDFVLNVSKGFNKCQFLPLTCPVEIIRSMTADHGLKGDKVFCFLSSVDEATNATPSSLMFWLILSHFFFFTGSVQQALGLLSQGPSEWRTWRFHLAGDPFSGSKQQHRAV